jgi:hypothetical protein
VVLLAPRERVIPALAGFVMADSLRVRRMNTEDGYLETEWYDTRTHRSYMSNRVPDLGSAVKLRCWADPYVASETMLTIEAAYRPRYDPSQLERHLELVVPPERDGGKLAAQLLARLKERFGSPGAPGVPR